MDFWGLMIKKDDMIISCVEGIRSIIINFSPSFFWRKRQMRKITPVGVGKDIYIILNAPSLKTQDLSVLKGKETMFVNRGFMHPMYKDLQPAYHVFVDTKMLKGIWPATWIGDILQMSRKYYYHYHGVILKSLSHMKRVFIGLIGIFLLIIWVYQDLVSLLQYNKNLNIYILQDLMQQV